MSTNIAINGMGRIGRMVLRIALHKEDLNVVAINASYPPETIAHLINYDTTHGRFDKKLNQLRTVSVSMDKILNLFLTVTLKIYLERLRH